ncbi:MAG: hemolysin family protein [Pseudonocardiaceae bacterium]
MSLPTIFVSVMLIALSAFFVAVEFSLVAARRYRLEETAAVSVSARAALRSARELSLLLAGSQLGITLCTLGLGAVTKPALDAALEPLLTSWGLPTATAGVLAFMLSLVLVTFLHLVVGEMAPKSWAISHPEWSATLLALPMRAFMWFTRPLLVALNSLANLCLRLVGVEPVDEVGAGRTPADLRELVDHSATAGALDLQRRDQIIAVLEFDSRPVREIVRPLEEISGVSVDATVEAIRAASRNSGHLRLIVSDDAGRPVGVVHVRDTLTRDPATTAADLLRPVRTLAADTPIHAALRAMREGRNHIALVTDGETLLGLVTMHDLLDRLLPAP